MKRACCLIAISILSGSVGCKKAPPSARPEPPHVVEIDPSKCEFAKEAETVWNEAVRDSLDLSVKIMDDVIEAWEAENLTLELDEFITEALKQVFTGIFDAKATATDTGFQINPWISTGASDTSGVLLDRQTKTPLQIVEFDVAVTTLESEQSKGGAGLFVAGFGLGG